MPKINNRKPPSRIRYEEDNPTFSVRLPRTLYDNLDLLREGTGLSFGDFIREVLGELEASAFNSYIEGHHDGEGEGHDYAKAMYLIKIPCSRCKKPVEVKYDAIKQAAIDALVERGWGHTTCVKGPSRLEG